MSDTAKGAFWERKNRGFGSCSEADDLLHTALCRTDPSDSITETQYFGYNIPELRIHGLAYMWHHPNLRVVMGGVWAWQGVKQHNLQSELFDIVTFMSDDCLRNDLHDYRFSNSYHVKTLELLKRHRISYHDPVRDNRLLLEYEAVTPPVMLSTGRHFEQGMRVSGELRLRGQSYEVKGHSVRDRSWGQTRPETHSASPPMSWATGSFGDDFFFSCTSYDDPALRPEWAGTLAVPGEDPCKGGWIFRDGKITEIIGAQKLTRRNEVTLFPESVWMLLTGADGRQTEIKGEIIASANWRTWHNIESVICLSRWECEGRVGYSDFQEFQWADYIRMFRG